MHAHRDESGSSGPMVADDATHRPALPPAGARLPGRARRSGAARWPGPSRARSRTDPTRSAVAGTAASTSRPLRAPRSARHARHGGDRAGGGGRGRSGHADVWPLARDPPASGRDRGPAGLRVPRGRSARACSAAAAVTTACTWASAAPATRSATSTRCASWATAADRRLRRSLTVRREAGLGPARRRPACAHRPQRPALRSVRRSPPASRMAARGGVRALAPWPAWAGLALSLSATGGLRLRRWRTRAAWRRTAEEVLSPP